MDMQYTQMCTARLRSMPDNFAKKPSNSCTGLQSSQISDSANTDEWEDLNEDEEFFLQQVEATYKDRLFSEKQDSEERVTATETQIEHNVGQKTAHEKDYCEEDAACSTPEMEYVRLGTEMHKNAEQLEFKTKQSTDADMSKEMKALQSKEIKEEIRQFQEFAEAEQDSEKQEAQKQFLIDMRSVNLNTKRQRTEQEEDCKEERMKKKRKQGLPKWIAWMIRYC